MHEALILYPLDPQWAPPRQFVQSLHDCGLIDRPDSADNSYEFGNAFTSLISFIGCSPTLYNSTGSKLFNIMLPAAANAAVFIAGNMAKPRCRQCRKIIDNWQHQGETVSCPHCHKESHINRLYWKRQAALTRCPIIITGIMDGIAVPSDKLLAILRETSRCEWDYFYYADTESWPC